MMDTEALWQAIAAYGNARWRGVKFEQDAADHLSEIKRLLNEADEERAELLKENERLNDERDKLREKLNAKAELLRGCYAADHKQKQRINVLERTLTHIHGVAMAEDHRDLPGIAKDAKEALEKKNRTVTYICPVCAASL